MPPPFPITALIQQKKGRRKGAMAQPPKPWKAEYAKSSRSSCKTCNTPIQKQTLRLGKMSQSYTFDGVMTMWNHATCILREGQQIKLADDVEGLELLRLEDQQKIRKYVDDGGQSELSAPTDVERAIEVSHTSRATCRNCNQKIAKGEIRISSKGEGQSARSLTWNHAKCYMEIYPTSQVEKFCGWDSLSDSDRTTVLVKKKNPAGTSKTKRGGTKRKKGAVQSDHKSKIAKA